MTTENCVVVLIPLKSGHVFDTPLTDKKIWDIASDYFDADAQYDGVIAFARAIEAAHGIKGATP